MGRKHLKVIHKPGGYEAYKDQLPIRTVNAKAMFSVFGVVFALGVVTTLVFSALASSPQSQPVAAVPSPEATTEVTEATAEITEAAELPTVTPTMEPTSTTVPTVTPTPVMDLQLTMDALNARMAQLEQPTLTSVVTEVVIVTSTPEPIVTATTAYAGTVVVIVDCAIIRAGPGTQYRAMASACRGARFPMLDTWNSWVQLHYEGANSAWIAAHLVRIDQ